MGTSQSSRGSPGGVPMVPNWVPQPAPGPVPAPENPPGAAPPDPANPPTPASPAPAPPPPAPASPVAPDRRFASARTNMSRFASGSGGGGGGGRAGAMRRGVGHYVRTGYGGAGTATRRMGGTANTAGALYNALSSTASGTPAAPGSPLDPTLLSGRSATEVMDAVVEAVRPDHGTLDAEASRASIRDALAEVLTRYPEADLLNLTADERAFTVERYVAADVFRRIDLDLGKTVRDKAATAATASARIKEIKDYVKETVSAAFRKLATAGRALSAGRVEQVVREAIFDTMQVFESYAE